MSVTATTVRATGRSLKSATSAFKNARKRATKTRDAYDIDQADKCRNALENELADTASVIRRASSQGLEHFNLLTAVESAERLIAEDFRRQAVVLPADAPLGAAPLRMPAAPAREEVPLIDFDLPASWVVPRIEGGSAQGDAGPAASNDAGPAAPNDAAVPSTDAAAPAATGAAATASNGNTRALSPIIQVQEGPGSSVPSSPRSRNSWETRSKATGSSREEIRSQHEREAALIDDEEEILSLTAAREALIRRTELQLAEMEARERELARKRHFEERRRQNDAARDDAEPRSSILRLSLGSWGQCAA